jgi:hypothetical protein
MAMPHGGHGSQIRDQPPERRTPPTPKENDMNTRKIARTAGIGAGLAATTLIPLLGATAGSAQAAGAVQSCTIRIVSIKALDLQEDVQGQDEVFLRLGDSSTTQRTYFEGQKRNTLGDGDDVFVNRERVRLVENDGPGNNDVLDSTTIACAAASATSTLSDAAGDAIYKVSWTVSVNP